MTVVACTPSPVTPGIVVFDSTEFLAMFPEFTGIDALTPSPLPGNFARATLQLNNTCGSLVTDANARQTLLYILTAHITFLFNGTNDGESPPNITPPPGIVGRIATATEGSVSVGADFAVTPGNAQAYYIQTRYGTEFWQATAQYRTMRYAANPTRWAPFGLGYFGPGSTPGGGCGCG